MKASQLFALTGLILFCLLTTGPGFSQESAEPPAEPAAAETPEAEPEATDPAPAPAPAAKPTLPGGVSTVNPEALRMMEMIEKKNRDLKRREEELLLREKNLKLLEEKVLADLKKIEAALVRSEEQVGIKRDLIEKNVQSLVKAYSAMKPQEAATLLQTMDEAIAIQIISKMKSKTAGKVLARMDNRVARNISEKIAGKPPVRKK